MELARLLDELTRAAERAGVRVRLEAFDPNLSDVRRPRGGICTLRGARIILVDAKLPLPEQIATVAEALAGVDLEHLFLPPIVRATIGAYAPVTTGEPPTAGPDRPKPRPPVKPPVDPSGERPRAFPDPPRKRPLKLLRATRR